MKKAEELEELYPDHYEIDSEAPEKLQKAVIAMGCFWGVEALFGGLKGVYRTAVGYTGGEKDNPTYHSLGNHTETLMLEFNPEEISYEDILKLFFANHDQRKKTKAQYASRIFYVNKKQEKEAKKMKSSESKTSIEKFKSLWLAEDYHQKYRLRGTREAEKILEHYNNEEFIRSTLTTKLNSEMAGKLKEELDLET